MAELTKYQSELYEKIEKNEERAFNFNIGIVGSVSLYSSIPILLAIVVSGTALFSTKIIDEVTWVTQIFILLIGIVAVFFFLGNLIPSSTTTFSLLMSTIICLTYFYSYSYLFHSNIKIATQETVDYRLDYQSWLTYSSLHRGDKLCGERLEISPKQNHYPEIKMTHDEGFLKIFDKDCAPLSWPVSLKIADPSFSIIYFIAPKDEMILWANTSTQFEVQLVSTGVASQKENLLIKIESPLWEGMRQTYKYILGIVVLGLVSDFIKTRASRKSK